MLVIPSRVDNWWVCVETEILVCILVLSGIKVFQNWYQVSTEKQCDLWRVESQDVVCGFAVVCFLEWLKNGLSSLCPSEAVCIKGLIRDKSLLTETWARLGFWREDIKNKKKQSCGCRILIMSSSQYIHSPRITTWETESEEYSLCRAVSSGKSIKNYALLALLLQRWFT